MVAVRSISFASPHVRYGTPPGRPSARVVSLTKLRKAPHLDDTTALSVVAYACLAHHMMAVVYLEWISRVTCERGQFDYGWPSAHMMRQTPAWSLSTSGESNEIQKNTWKNNRCFSGHVRGTTRHEAGLDHGLERAPRVAPLQPHPRRSPHTRRSPRACQRPGRF